MAKNNQCYLHEILTMNKRLSQELETATVIQIREVRTYNETNTKSHRIGAYKRKKYTLEITIRKCNILFLKELVWHT